MRQILATATHSLSSIERIPEAIHQFKLAFVSLWKSLKRANFEQKDDMNPEQERRKT
jgi:uncharacterized membrane protein YccF (DUF307 family)